MIPVEPRSPHLSNSALKGVDQVNGLQYAVGYAQSGCPGYAVKHWQGGRTNLLDCRAVNTPILRHRLEDQHRLISIRALFPTLVLERRGASVLLGLSRGLHDFRRALCKGQALT